MSKGIAIKRIGLMLAILVIFTASAQEAQQKKIRAYIFLGIDCPISQDYVGIINKLKQQFPQIDFVGVLPAANNHDKNLFKKEYQVGFELKPDKKKKMVEKYAITVTPEVVLVDGESRIRYQGAIDNWYFELGRHRPQATEFYLASALEDVLALRDVRVTRTKAIGCILSLRK
jgi:hypothetical protein